MRIVFIGAGELAVETAALLIKRNHEVVIIETDRDRVDELKDDMDCSFLHGDGSKPQVLKEADPEHTDYLFCLTENDQYNIIAALVGRSLGFDRVVLQIYDADYMNICNELDLRDTINPSQTISRYLADMAAGIDMMELSTFIKDEVRFLMIDIDADLEGSIEDLDLPDEARAICIYRDDEFLFPEEDTKLKEKDEVILLTHSKHLEELTERFIANDDGSSGD